MNKQEIDRQKKDNQGVEIKKTLWIISELYYPEDNQTGYYMTKIAEGLRGKYQIKVICAQPNYSGRGIRAPKTEVYNGVQIFRVRSTTLDKNVVIFRLINMITQGISMFTKSLLMIGKDEEILMVSSPPSLPYVTALMAKIKKARYTLIIQDIYPDILVAVGKIRADSFFVQTLNKLNGWLYRGAKKIVVVGRDMRELVKSRIEPEVRQKIPVEVIQNWASLEEVEPTPRETNQLLKELGLLDKFVFLYAGNMGHAQDLESIVECVKKLKDDHRIHFLFIGSGVKRKWLEREFAGNNLENATILDPRPRTEQTLFLNACDVGFVSLIKKMNGLAMPSRTYNFLAAGKPVLALTEENSEISKVINEDRVGWCVPPDEPDKLLEMIYKIYSQRANFSEMEKRARHSALTKYSLETALAKYDNAYS